MKIKKLIALGLVLVTLTGCNFNFKKEPKQDNAEQKPIENVEQQEDKDKDLGKIDNKEGYDGTVITLNVDEPIQIREKVTKTPMLVTKDGITGIKTDVKILNPGEQGTGLKFQTVDIQDLQLEGTDKMPRYISGVFDFGKYLFTADLPLANFLNISPDGYIEAYAVAGPNTITAMSTVDKNLFDGQIKITTSDSSKIAMAYDLDVIAVNGSISDMVIALPVKGEWKYYNPVTTEADIIIKPDTDGNPVAYRTDSNIKRVKQSDREVLGMGDRYIDLTGKKFSDYKNIVEMKELKIK